MNIWVGIDRNQSKSYLQLDHIQEIVISKESDSAQVIFSDGRKSSIIGEDNVANLLYALEGKFSTPLPY